VPGLIIFTFTDMDDTSIVQERLANLKMKKTCILENICKLNLFVKMKMDQFCNTTLK
jgi:hypothetical protein